MNAPQRIQKQAESPSHPAGATRSTVTEDLERSSRGRLASMALIYSAVYLVMFAYANIQCYLEHSCLLPTGQFLTAATFILFGLVVFVLIRRGKFTWIRFGTLAAAFQIIAALGIAKGFWGWEGQWLNYEEHWAALFPAAAAGLAPGSVQTQFVEPLVGAGIRLVHYAGVTWIGIWIIAFPLIVPASPRTVILRSLLSFATLPLIIFGSVLAHGTPHDVTPWLPGLYAELLIPTFVCVGIAFYGAGVLHKMSRDLSRARRMGSYQLIERIGAGGMGEVWKARHRMLARPGAIKLIHPESLGARDGMAAQVIMKRFEKEAQATAALESPHTVQLYDFGMSEDGTFYYVMELLRGLNLKTLVERFGPVPAARAVHLLTQACHSLQDAHASGMVHRDVKPANIFTCRRGQEHDFVKVLDFGLVKDIAVDRASAELTMDGMTSGTPGYMAPEMAVSAKDIDGRADIYALGCVAYWLLTGRLVFDGDTPMSIILQHVQAQPEAPSARTEIEVPEALDEIVLDCLKKNPAERPQSARELMTRLERSLPPSGAWTSEKAEEWWGMHIPQEGQRDDSSLSLKTATAFVPAVS